MAKIAKIVKQVKQTAKKRKPKKKTETFKTKDLLSSGSTLLNLACSNNPLGAIPAGKFCLFVGDSASGKTFLSMTCFAESGFQERFKSYRLIYDNVEDGMNMDVENLFGEKVAERIETPTADGEHSFYIEDFFYNVDDALIKARTQNKPFVYILDSMDGLSSTAEESKFDEHKKAHRKGTKTAGSFGDGKAKKNSEGLRKILKGLRETGSILLIISQTRDNIGFGATMNPKSRSGGKALRFYATIEFWSSVTGQIKKTVRKKVRKIGTHIKIQMKKNRVSGELHEATMDIYPTYGIDDIGSCIDYLCDESITSLWSKSDKTIKAIDFDMKCTRDKLIEHIEENNLQHKLQIITGRCWNEIRKACKSKRKSRYGK